MGKGTVPPPVSEINTVEVLGIECYGIHGTQQGRVTVLMRHGASAQMVRRICAAESRRDVHACVRRHFVSVASQSVA